MRADIPFWFYKLKGTAAQFLLRDTGFDLESLGIAPADLQQRGPGIVLDEARDNGDTGHEQQAVDPKIRMAVAVWMDVVDYRSMGGGDAGKRQDGGGGNDYLSHEFNTPLGRFVG